MDIAQWIIQLITKKHKPELVLSGHPLKTYNQPARYTTLYHTFGYQCIKRKHDVHVKINPFIYMCIKYHPDLN